MSRKSEVGKIGGREEYADAVPISDFRFFFKFPTGYGSTFGLENRAFGDDVLPRIGSPAQSVAATADSGDAIVSEKPSLP